VSGPRTQANRRLAAAVLTREELAPHGHRFVGMVSLAATEHNGLCRGQNDWMKTDATGLLHAGVELGQRTWEAAERELGWSQGELGLAIMHQVSRVHTESIAKKLGLPLERVPMIYREHGNVGPASVPTTLVQAAAEGRTTRGARIGLMGIGSGLNCAMAEIVW